MRNTTPKLHVCNVCNQTGKSGARWLLLIEGQTQPKRVHKPCGEMLLKSAPEGITPKLVPSRELREEWRERRLAEKFWGTAFQNAKPLKTPPAKEPEPVLGEVATPPPVTVESAAA